MFIDHKERLIREPSLRDLSNWPTIALQQINKSKRAGFRRNWRAVKMALEGKRYRDIKSATGLHPAQVTRLLKRALSGQEETTPPLTRALIPSEQVQKTVRRKPLSRIDAPSGAKASFQYLLDVVPGLKNKLDTVLEPYVKNSAHGENIKPAAFHQYFLLFLEQAHHPTDSYPYTEDLLGYESARVYMHTRLNELHRERIAKNQPKRIIAPHERPFEVGREIQLDEQTYDAESSVYLELEGNLIPVRVSRFSVVIASDADSTCALSFQLAFTHHCSQYDVLNALELPTLYTEPVKLHTPGIYVPPGPCFPNQLGEEYTRIAFNTVALDNALAHCAKAVEQYVCDTHFGTISLGLPATPTARNVIESAFRLLTENAKRFKSTSGSHPKDPLREPKNLKKKVPVVTVFELEEAIYAVLAKHNLTPKPHLMGNTPLDLYRHMLSENPLRLLPENWVHHRRSPFELSQVVKVKWLKHEGRSPHINFCGCRYRGQCLMGLENQQVTVAFDYRDIRQLQVHTADSRADCTVYAPKSWQHFPHGVKTRQYIKKFCRLKRIRMKDPLVEYFWLQSQRTNKKKSTLELLRLYREYNGSIRPRLDSDESESEVVSHKDTIPKKISQSSDIPAWSTEMAYACDKNQN
jgi:hypothetical protein